MVDMVREEIQKHGGRAKIVPVGRIGDIRHDLESLKNSNTLNGFQNYILSGIYRLDLPDTGFEIRSVIVTASPTPYLTKITFNRDGRRISLPIPSGYVLKDSIPIKTEQYLNQFLSAMGYHAIYAPGLPHKLLAARSGLGAYGRNNICYVDGMGSFLVLALFYSDIPCEDEEWHELQPMEHCNGCKACLHSCPTGAIREDRFLIDNERCLTNRNEGFAGTDFPEWVPLSAHHCVYGCLKCQTVCPMDREYLGNIGEPAEFSDEETSALLEGKPRELFSDELLQKVKNLNMLEYLDVLPRNLKILFDREK
jgi:epoxyqueuosine reductase